MSSIEIWIPLPDSTRTSASSNPVCRFTACGDTLMSHLALLSTDGAHQRKWLRPKKAGHKHKQKMNEYISYYILTACPTAHGLKVCHGTVVSFQTWWTFGGDFAVIQRQVVSLWVVMDRVDMLAPVKDIQKISAANRQMPFWTNKTWQCQNNTPMDSSDPSGFMWFQICMMKVLYIENW